MYRAAGCEACNGWGYSGRIATAELLLMNQQLQSSILQREDSNRIKSLARSSMRTMREEGWEKLKLGLTTFEDVLRQTQRDEIEAM